MSGVDLTLGICGERIRGAECTISRLGGSRGLSRLGDAYCQWNGEVENRRLASRLSDREFKIRTLANQRVRHPAKEEKVKTRTLKNQRVRHPTEEEKVKTRTLKNQRVRHPTEEEKVQNSHPCKSKGAAPD